MRISQVAFSTDDNFLVLSAENGGGLAVYETQSLMQGNTQTAFELATNGTALRSLLPNPTLEKAELFAAVLTNGELMIADLKNRSFIVGNQRQTLKTGVSCVSWSNKGKQLVAGLGDGSLYQMKPEGEGTGNVPKPPGMEGDEHGKRFSRSVRLTHANQDQSHLYHGSRMMYFSWRTRLPHLEKTQCKYPRHSIT